MKTPKEIEFLEDFNKTNQQRLAVRQPRVGQTEPAPLAQPSVAPGRDSELVSSFESFETTGEDHPHQGESSSHQEQPATHESDEDYQQEQPSAPLLDLESNEEPDDSLTPQPTTFHRYDMSDLQVSANETQELSRLSILKER